MTQISSEYKSKHFRHAKFCVCKQSNKKTHWVGTKDSLEYKNTEERNAYTKYFWVDQQSLNRKTCIKSIKMSVLYKVTIGLIRFFK